MIWEINNGLTMHDTGMGGGGGGVGGGGRPVPHHHPHHAVAAAQAQAMALAQAQAMAVHNAAVVQHQAVVQQHAVAMAMMAAPVPAPNPSPPGVPGSVLGVAGVGAVGAAGATAPVVAVSFAPGVVAPAGSFTITATAAAPATTPAMTPATNTGGASASAIASSSAFTPTATLQNPGLTTNPATAAGVVDQTTAQVGNQFLSSFTIPMHPGHSIAVHHAVAANDHVAQLLAQIRLTDAQLGQYRTLVQTNNAVLAQLEREIHNARLSNSGGGDATAANNILLIEQRREQTIQNLRQLQPAEEASARQVTMLRAHLAALQQMPQHHHQL